jgi:hypothetical protein
VIVPLRSRPLRHVSDGIRNGAPGRGPGAAHFPRFTITLDGGGYQHQQITKPLVGADACNDYWKSSRDPRINRLALCSDGSNGGLGIRSTLPAMLGVRLREGR